MRAKGAKWLALKKNAGFTLYEAVLALTIMSLLSLSAWPIVRQGQRWVQQLQVRAQRWDKATRSYLQLDKDTESMLPGTLQGNSLTMEFWVLGPQEPIAVRYWWQEGQLWRQTQDVTTVMLEPLHSGYFSYVDPQGQESTACALDSAPKAIQLRWEQALLGTVEWIFWVGPKLA